MIRKEDLAITQQVFANIENEKRLKHELRQREWEASQTASILAREVEIRRKESELRATGVVDYFEAIRDQAIVKQSDAPLFKETEEYQINRLGFVTGSKKVRVKICDYTPAIVSFEESSVLAFPNHKSLPTFVGKCMQAKLEFGGDCYINARVLNGKLFINDLEVGAELSMAVAVGKALADPRRVPTRGVSDNWT